MAVDGPLKKGKTMNDIVNHPPHYTSHKSGVECIEITEHMGFCLGNAIKYIWRADLKQNAVEDLEKAKWYIDREIKKLKGEGKMQESENYLSQVIWRPINARCDYTPDADKEILIYDGYIDDVVKGYLSYPDDYELGDDISTLEWIDIQTDEKLADPQFWTDIPFPRDV